MRFPLLESLYTVTHISIERASIRSLPLLLLKKLFKSQDKFLNKSKSKTFKMLVESEKEI